MNWEEQTINARMQKSRDAEKPAPKRTTPIASPKQMRELVDRALAESAERRNKKGPAKARD